MSKPVLFRNIGELLSLKGVYKKKGRSPEVSDLSLIKKAAFVVDRGQIVWVGKEAKIPDAYKASEKVDLQGRNVFPGFIDCHTHLIFAGDRKDEFELRNQGVSYQEIAKKGGGILSTMKATRKASLEELIAIGQERADRHLLQGITTVEIKSGYGLNKKAEEKMLEAAGALKKIQVVPTFLGAHAIPKNFDGEKDYLESLKTDLESIRRRGLARRVDIFIEKGYFSTKAGKDFLEYAQDRDFDVCIHADQLNRTGATALAVELGALSADHCILANYDDVKKIAASETVAVLLPAADFYLQCKYPPARELIDRGACVALATDFNPGSSPTQSLALVGLLARLEMKMSLPEVFSALTYGGAKALGLEKTRGQIKAGYTADFFVSDWSWNEFFYDLAQPHFLETYVAGEKVASNFRG